LDGGRGGLDVLLLVIVVGSIAGRGGDLAGDGKFGGVGFDVCSDGFGELGVVGLLAGDGLGVDDGCEGG
jgi:hypothetical protein